MGINSAGEGEVQMLGEEVVFSLCEKFNEKVYARMGQLVHVRRSWMQRKSRFVCHCTCFSL